MKVALCFSGAIRGFDTCIPSIYHYFINPLKQQNIQVDIFIYMVYLNEIDKDMNIKFKMRKTKSDIDRILQILKPKLHVIEEYNNNYQKKEMIINNIDYRTTDFRKYVKKKDWKKRDKLSVDNYAYNAFGMFYKIFKCNQLKSQYENDNNFKYDFVWRCRLDYIFLDYLTYDLTNKNIIYMIEDRFATNTRGKLFKTNDKFIGGSSELMNQVCNLYNCLPKYLKDGIQFDGSSLIQHHIKTDVKMIGHENTYFKCQGRHEINPINRYYYIDLVDKKILFNLAYTLLSMNYKVVSDYKNEVLGLFIGYSSKKHNIYQNCIIDKLMNIKVKNKRIHVNLPIISNNQTIVILHKNQSFLNEFLISCLKFKNNCKSYNLSNINNKLRIGVLVRFTIPDRGFYNGTIKEIKDDYCMIEHCRKNMKINKKYIKILNFF